MTKVKFAKKFSNKAKGNVIEVDAATAANLVSSKVANYVAEEGNNSHFEKQLEKAAAALKAQVDKNKALAEENKRLKAEVLKLKK
jgi:cell shape-determining protein MreC